MRTWKVRPVEETDLPRLRDCFEAVYGHRRGLDHDIWTYFRNPAGDAVAFVAVVGDRIVGQYAVMPMSLALAGTTVPAAQSIDTMTHPDFRGQGILRELANECFERCHELGLEVLYGFPNENSYGPLTRLNYDHVTDVSVLVRPLGSRRTAETTGPGALGLGIAGRVLPSGRTGTWVVDVGFPSPGTLEEITHLWEAQQGRCRVSRSPGWWSWRFAPEWGQYEWVVARSPAGDVRAAVVWGRSGVKGALVDAVGGDRAAMVAAASTVVRRARDSDLAFLLSVTNHPLLLRALHRVGFIKFRRLPLIVRRLSHRTLSANVHDAAGWSVTAADIDTF